ncbi:alpha-1,4-glucan--maltose-1-phosphate maltosyltransferase [Achromobacter seleniivolatilans]|uniref:Alpha-1,4-glucan:maltose-1-phosphate maltosyltransferase n=1 Tax=Achromobacter seleniivolatilans TaxID=3047478 RepID=A0ABY9M7R9_9BURK|nr:alpha-1,4-glucan--maltose-1-phosphate maltosyltransferase [Achromobacter sp. R39]WMD22213.1 alpha-1,4-glucan--maltose-1-phosphate maltosyltransferase [Achromobacter sp. R39]
MTDALQSTELAPPRRIFHARAGLPDGSPGTGGLASLNARVQRIQTWGFDTVLIPAPWLRPEDALSLAPLDADLSASGATVQPITERLARTAKAVSAQGLDLFVRVTLDRVAVGAPETTAAPGWHRAHADDPARDPRLPAGEGRILHLLDSPPAAFVQAWSERLTRWTACGVSGFLFEAPDCLSADAWQALLAPMRKQAPALRFLAWTPGLSPSQLDGLRPAGFDGVFSSLPWWDYQAAWLADEAWRLRRVAPVMASTSPLDGVEIGRPLPDRRTGWAAAVSAQGWMAADDDIEPLGEAQEINQWLVAHPLTGLPRVLGGRDARATLVLRDAADHSAAILALNFSTVTPAAIDWDAVATCLPPGEIAPHRQVDDACLAAEQLPPAGCALLAVAPMSPVREASLHPGPRTEGGASLRIAIERVSPAVDGGAYPVKYTVHERIVVQADLLMDGHDQMAGELRWRAADESKWRIVPLKAGLNDRWQASFRPRRIGPHEFQIAAWFDAWQTLRHDIEVKHLAGVDVRLEVQEAVQLLSAAQKRSAQPGTSAVRSEHRPDSASWVERALKAATAKDAQAPGNELIAQLVAEDLALAMRDLDPHPFESVTPAPFPVWVDRQQACHAAWYELFPRSQAQEPGRHGTFDDVIERLPDIQEMGFDVLYLPPIHPIGMRNRKGPNNSLQAGPGDVGSPYAIGSPDGGHDAIEPKLGTLQDFLRLVQASHDHGMEVALDFAIQCSPDHPWLKQHPDWFSWRPDGSLRYAENPPKKYEDIVNVSFYGSPPRRARRLSLWRALRDVVLFWVDHGVRIFRVDNPHTKPLPFWQWLIAEVHGQHPDVLFLSEAFTRPKMMYRLAKVGFTQSYTYFTWRNNKVELQEYLQEISQPPPADFFRPHFFVNTPDINPVFLQTSGRPGFLIRAALAATGSGLWGMYSGFELCEAAPVPGKEEYLDSEKYEIRQRNWRQPGNIRAEITRLNLIRRANPALQSHRGLTVAATGNDRVLAFIKATPGRGNVVLTAISLDPFHAQTAQLDTPFWFFGEPRPGHLMAEDLLADTRDTWREPARAVTLTPDQPYRIWRLSLNG